MSFRETFVGDCHFHKVLREFGIIHSKILMDPINRCPRALIKVNFYTTVEPHFIRSQANFKFKVHIFINFLLFSCVWDSFETPLMNVQKHPYKSQYILRVML